MIGRDEEIATARQQLTQHRVQLLTLTGPAGVGKTRLALAVATEIVDAFAHGAWFVDLTSLTDPTLIAQFIARTIGVRPAGPAASLDRLILYLRDRQALLVLDNFEHVLPAASALPDLLAHCPGLKLLVTSREPLRLRCEHRFAVPPLTLPDLGLVPTDETTGRSPAEQLFLERARAANPRFAPSPDDRRAIAEVCVRLDGLPLAIELAAAHSDVLSPREMLARLDRHLPLPCWNAVDLPARHRTLRAAIDWSYDRLGEPERRVFRLLGLFVGGFTADAVEAVRGEPSDPLEVLTSLADKSLVQVVPGSGPTGGMRAGPRFRLLETIRAHAREQLESHGELAVGEERHAAFYRCLAEQAEPRLRGPEQRDWDERLELEHGNLRAALHWGEAAGDPDFLPRLAGALTRFWWDRGDLAEGRAWLERALALGSATSPATRAKALGAAGALAFLQGDLEHATGWLEAGVALAREHETAPQAAEALAHLGLALALRGDRADATATLEEALRVARGAGDIWVTAFALRNRAALLLHQDQFAPAMADLTQSLGLFREAGDARNAAIVLSQLGRAEWRQANEPIAIAHLREALDLGVALHDRRVIAIAAGVAGLVAADRGEPAAAARVLAAAEALRTAHGILLFPESRAAQERALATLESHLTPEGLVRASAEGLTWSPEQVAFEALAAFESLIPAPGGVSSSNSHLPAESIPPSHGRPPTTRKSPGSDGALSERELEVLRLVARGHSNKQIARALNLSERTIKAHLTAAFNKLSAENRAQAAVLATQRGMV